MKAAEHYEHWRRHWLHGSRSVVYLHLLHQQGLRLTLAVALEVSNQPKAGATEPSSRPPGSWWPNAAAGSELSCLMQRICRRET